MNSLLALRGNAMYAYGGLYEPEEASEVTLNDLWVLDLTKLDGWTCLFAGAAPEESLAKEESSEDESEDESEESEEEEEEEEEEESEDSEGSARDLD